MTDGRNLPTPAADAIRPPQVPSEGFADDVILQTMHEMATGRLVSPEEAAFIGQLSILADAERRATLPQIEALQQQNDHLRRQVENKPAIGALQELRRKIETIQDELGAANAALLIARTAEDRALLRAAQERENAQTDELTGVYNRKAIDSIMIGGAIDVIEDKAGAKQFMMSFIDINYLKKVNDAFGHTKGDELIKAVADAAADWAHRYAPNLAVVRYGGDELTVSGAVDPSTLSDEQQNLQSWINRRLATSFAASLPRGRRGRRLGPKIGVSIGTVWTDKEAVQEAISLVEADSQTLQAEILHPSAKRSEDLNQSIKDYLTPRSRNQPRREERSLTQTDIEKIANKLALDRAVEGIHAIADAEMYKNKVAQKRGLRWYHNSNRAVQKSSAER